ncbi:IstB-like ATP binding N-terminal [Rhizobium tibeticum]|uniref:IstB-like ATP binding N-terminal n=1 Tax=Rhizobium tibeticum TaxID=501024 RepID=A0A1H8WH16_9HYPH|nr:hypothetical protein RTCCBAU85039_6550 [Rhizobium tibeticum]SEP26909.1 IstB-like ATP binding N-terminal [Rhizobium tibeticum]
MLTHPTFDQMHALGLSGIAAAYRELANQPEGSDLNRDEWLGLMLDREMAVRGDKRLTNRLAIANCASPMLASRTSTSPPIAALAADSFSPWPKANGSKPMST